MSLAGFLGLLSGLFPCCCHKGWGAAEKGQISRVKSTGTLRGAARDSTVILSEQAHTH